MSLTRTAASHVNQPPPPVPGTRVRSGRMPLRSELHPRFTINWAALFTVAATALLFFLLGMAVMLGAARDLLIEDEHNGVPACTDAIADAGGICWGEPR